MYTKNDIGCWIDGAFGHDHAHEKLASMLHWNGRRVADCTEDYCSLDDDTELLERATEDGIYWVWEAGDLILTRPPEDL